MTTAAPPPTTKVILESEFGTLTANTPALVATSTKVHTELHVWNLSATDVIYGSLDGTEPGSTSTTCFVVPPLNSVPVIIPLPILASNIEVRLVSAGAQAYGVVFMDRAR